MTVEEQELLKVCRSVREYRNAQEEEHAILWGIHLEGPFLSAGKAGAQNPAFIRKPDAQDFVCKSNDMQCDQHLNHYESNVNTQQHAALPLLLPADGPRRVDGAGVQVPRRES